jgi:hypothetical protein
LRSVEIIPPEAAPELGVVPRQKGSPMRTKLFALALSCIAFAGCVAQSTVEEESVDEGGQASTAPGFDWFPGHYVLLSRSAPTSGTHEAAERDRLLADDLVTPFRGLQIEYDWSTFETSEGDYTAGFAALGDDLDALASVPASRGGPKKLVIMLQYRQFGEGAHAVPAYLRAPGSGYCAGGVCGEYQMGNGATAMVWLPAVRHRLEAWGRAVGSYVAAHHAHQVAAVVLPETATAQGPVPLSSVGYTADDYLSSLTGTLAALTAPGAFPHTPVIQYINFFSLARKPVDSLTQLAQFAADHPHAGIGCPDVGSVSGFHPPGYDVLGAPTFQGVVPFNVAVESPDFESARNATLAGAYARAIHPASKGGFGAQMVAWADVENLGTRPFDLQDVSDYIRNHPMPNTAPPGAN